MTAEKKREYNKAYRDAHKAEQREYKKAYYEAHKAERKAYCEAHKAERKANRDAHKAVRCEHDKSRRELWYGLAQGFYGMETLHCQKCGYSKCKAALEFHHRNREEKEVGLAKLAAKRCLSPTNIGIFLDELAKCDLLCANCHREVHNGGNHEATD